MKALMIMPLTVVIAFLAENTLLCNTKSNDTITNDYNEMITIPGGTTTLQGRQVTLTGFKIGKYEVTYSYWEEIIDWAINHEYTFSVNKDHPDLPGNRGSIDFGPDDQPVSGIAWRHAMIWCNALSEKEGLMPCYIYNNAIIKDVSDTIACDHAVLTLTSSGYRLPTEAEWEYAARYQNGKTWTPENYFAGASADYKNDSICGTVATYNDNYDYAMTDATGNEFNYTGTSVVGSRNPTNMGLYDMSGNVCEWCWDWYGTITGISDPTGPAKGSARIIRGGSYKDCAIECQVGHRDRVIPSYHSEGIGFRLVKR